MKNTQKLKNRLQVAHDRENNPGHKALHELFVPIPQFKTLSKFISDKHGNRVLRPQPVEAEVPTINEENSNGEC